MKGCKFNLRTSSSQCLITDGQGDSLVISKNGQPMGINEYRATGGNKALLKEYHRKSDSLAQWQINFSQYDAHTYAFIYDCGSTHTIAHELGHGIAGLEHPFSESQVSGSTQNLMDYRDGTEFWHFQWDMLQDPAGKIFKWWQNEHAKGWAKKKVRDFVTAWAQEFMAQMVLYPAKRYLLGDNSVNRQDFLTYMFSSEVLESCTRNAFNSVIKGKNKWGKFFL